MRTNFLFGISSRFHELSQAYRQVAHVLLTRPPLVPQAHAPKGDCLLPALDLHVLGTPPAFVLSQDQTLQKSLCETNTVSFLSQLIADNLVQQLLLFFQSMLYFLTYWLFCSVFKEQICWPLTFERLY